MDEEIINKIFYDIINGEDWSDTVNVDLDDTPILIREMFASREVPIGAYILPTSIPGLWININLSLDIEKPEGDDDDARW